MKSAFLPCTREVEIAPGMVYRPVRSWHAGNLAGEGVRQEHGDSSGCVFTYADREVTYPPKTATHRLYWSRERPDYTISAFLSYPGGMGAPQEYFWEAYIGSEPDRFFGDNAESEMESAIVRSLTASLPFEGSEPNSG
jgi:hypothetical protein